jgi:hypothetical protein
MANRKGPELTIEVDRQGVRRIVVETDRGQRPKGTALLQRLLPTLDEVSRRASEEKGDA